MLEWRVAALLLAGMGFGDPAGPPERTAPVTGQYIEDRSSRVYGCPCEWSSEYASLGREVVIAWKIESGAYAGESLAGLRLAAVLSGQFTLSAATSARQSTVFVDRRAPASQRGAGVDWLRSRYGDLLGRILGVHEIPVDVDVNAETASLQVGEILSVRLRRANLLQDTQPWASLLYDPLTKLDPCTLGTSLSTQYDSQDLLMHWDRHDSSLTGITGYYGRFSRE